MATRPLTLATPAPAPIGTTPVAAAAAIAAFAVGILLARDISMGLALVVGLLYLPLALSNVGYGLALLIPLLFLTGLAQVDIAWKGALVLLGIAWVGTAATHRERIGHHLAEHARLLLVFLALMLWLVLSLAWSERPDMGAKALIPWVASAGAFTILISSVTTFARLRLVAAVFVLGALASILVSLLGIPVTPQNPLDIAPGRLQGAIGDPNILAAGVLPAMALVGGLFAMTRNHAQRWWLAIAFVLLAVGFVLTESRGGFIGAVLAIIVAVVIGGHQRRHLGRFVVASLVLIGLLLATTPSTLARLTNTSDAGNGRESLWLVAERMTADHPLLGVGLDNFRAESRSYINRPGSLRYVDLIVERPHVVHNTYLQLLAENGILGLSLFLLLVGSCLQAGMRGVRIFDALGDHAHAAFGRSVVVACVGMLGAALFLSLASETMLWVLLSLGPITLGLARRASAARNRAAGV